MKNQHYEHEKSAALTGRHLRPFFSMVLFILISFHIAIGSIMPYDSVCYSIIPRPVQIIPGRGNFSFDAVVTIITDSDCLPLARYCSDQIREVSGINTTVLKKRKKNSQNIISLALNKDLLKDQPEGYLLEVTPAKITISSSTLTGIFYGIQSLLQILPLSGAQKIPSVQITDYPRFPWRGMHLDVSRHFFSVEAVKSYIDMLALHKMNIFHWHLTDDQGWRIEIKKYPKLTQVSAWRVDRESEPEWRNRQVAREGEKATYGGFYTQEQIKEIVAYAQDRHITIVPEIEMPGHTKAVLAAYPQLSCSGGPFTIPPGGYWPIVDLYCAGNDSTFLFLQDVLKEVIELFPCPYIHIGGDEVDHSEWKKCPKCQARIQTEHLKDEHALQSYFVKRIAAFLRLYNKRLIGWDEIIEGDAPSEAIVMAWRGMDNGTAAARLGHDVVMTPSTHCYFDHYQGNQALEPLAIGGFTSLSTVYSFEPVPDSLTSEQMKHILGAQGNVWTEYIPTLQHIQYMALPRMAALAEVIWSPKELRSWSDFKNRLPRMFELYDKKKYYYAKSAY